VNSKRINTINLIYNDMRCKGVGRGSRKEVTRKIITNRLYFKEIMNAHRLAECGGKRIVGNSEALVLASDSEMLVRFVTPDGDGAASNISK
jgi:hypothetical protein